MNFLFLLHPNTEKPARLPETSPREICNRWRCQELQEGLELQVLSVSIAVLGGAVKGISCCWNFGMLLR